MELDVLCMGYDTITDEQRAAVVAAHPRPDFKNQIIASFAEGLKDRPHTTFGNVKADVLADKDPHFHRGNFCNVIRCSAWKDASASQDAV